MTIVIGHSFVHGCLEVILKSMIVIGFELYLFSLHMLFRRGLCSFVAFGLLNLRDNDLCWDNCFC